MYRPHFPMCSARCGMIAARRQECRLRPIALGDPKAEKPAVKRNCPVKIGNLQVNMANAGGRMNGRHGALPQTVLCYETHNAKDTQKNPTNSHRICEKMPPDRGGSRFGGKEGGLQRARGKHPPWQQHKGTGPPVVCSSRLAVARFRIVTRGGNARRGACGYPIDKAAFQSGAMLHDTTMNCLCHSVLAPERAIRAAARTAAATAAKGFARSARRSCQG